MGEKRFNDGLIRDFCGVCVYSCEINVCIGGDGEIAIDASAFENQLREDMRMCVLLTVSI